MFFQIFDKIKMTRNDFFPTIWKRYDIWLYLVYVYGVKMILNFDGNKVFLCTYGRAGYLMQLSLKAYRDETLWHEGLWDKLALLYFGGVVKVIQG